MTQQRNENTHKSIRLILVISFLVLAGIAIVADFIDVPGKIAASSGINTVWLRAGLRAFVILSIGTISLYYVSRAMNKSRSLEKELSAQEKRLTAFPKYNPDPVVEITMLGDITYINPAAEKLFSDLKSLGASHPYVRGIPKIIKNLAENMSSAVSREIKVGDRYYSQTVQYSSESNTVHVYGMDNTHSKMNQRHIQRINQILLAMRNINQILARERNTARILEAVCDNLVEPGGFSSSWIALLNEQQRVISATEVGLDDDFGTLREKMAQGLLPDCVNESLRGDKQLVIEPNSVYCTECALRDPSGKYNCIITPIVHKQRTWGIHVATMSKETRVSPEELGLVLELANDIAFALYSLERDERQQMMEFQVQTQRDLLSALINSSSDIIIFSVDKEYRYTSFNEAHRREMRRVWNGEIQMGANLLDCVTNPDTRQQFKTSIDRAFQGESFSETQHREGPDIYYDLHFSPVLSGNIVVGASAFIRNITVEIKSERALKLAHETVRENEERYRSLFENMVEGFALCHMLYDGDKPEDFIYLHVNRAFEMITGLKDVEGKKVSEVIPGLKVSSPQLFQVYARVARGGKPERFDFKVPQLNTWLAISVYSPSPEHFVAVFTDITKRKELG